MSCFETTDTSHAVCPWCGWEHFDTCDYGIEDGGATGGICCDSCGKDFLICEVVTITYTTLKPDTAP